MSDPVTNAEVEDVLSSIRRLVSEDKRPKPSPKPAGADRLVLTPALRVAEPPEAEQDDAEPGKAAASHALDDPNRPERERVEADGDRADRGQSDEPTEEWDDAEPLDDVTWHGQHQQIQKDDEDADVEHPEARTADHATAGDTATDDEGMTRDDADLVQDDVPDDDAQSHDASEENDSVASAETEDRDKRDTAALGAKIAALETAIGRIPDRWEPDGDDTGPYAGTEAASAMAWQDDVELDATGSPVDERAAFRRELDEIEEAELDAEPPTDEESAGLGGIPFGNDDQFMDEDALRDLVSDIVRAELQGALGERITRNVRKLVRREIHRALTAQELE